MTELLNEPQERALKSTFARLEIGPASHAYSKNRHSRIDWCDGTNGGYAGNCKSA